jgi:imidazolonepropionase-like amidohydrolase
MVLALAVTRPSTGQTGSPKPFAPPETGLVLLRNANLIDGNGHAPRSGMSILIRGERIERVLPDADVDSKLLVEAKIASLDGQFVMPALIDAHVHLATPPNRRQAEAIMRRDLYGGVTAVRDMADDLRAVGELARASLVGEIAGPDVYYADVIVGPRFFTDERTVQVSAGGVPGNVPWMQAVAEGTDLPLEISEARGTYATAIKLYADLSAELATRIRAAAHKQNMLVWAHATLFPAKQTSWKAQRRQQKTLSTGATSQKTSLSRPLRTPHRSILSASISTYLALTTSSWQG